MIEIHTTWQDMTKDKYMSGKGGPSINHFYEKLVMMTMMMI